MKEGRFHMPKTQMLFKNNNDREEQGYTGNGHPTPYSVQGAPGLSFWTQLAVYTHVSLKCVQLTNPLLEIYPQEKNHRYAIDD